MLLAIVILLLAWLVLLGALLIQQNTIHQRLKLMAENQAELAAEIRAFKETVKTSTAKVLKATGEVVQKIRRLEELIAAGGPITQELKDLAAELATDGTALSNAAQAADDVVPDATPA